MTMGQKFGWLSPFLWRGLGPHLTQSPLRWGLRPYQVASWCIQPFGHNGHGPKIGEGAPPAFWEGELGPHLTQSHLGEAYLQTKWHAFGGGEAGSSSNAMWPGPRSTCMPSFILIHPTVWP